MSDNVDYLTILFNLSSLYKSLDISVDVVLTDEDETNFCVNYVCTLYDCTILYSHGFGVDLLTAKNKAARALCSDLLNQFKFD